ncbi:MAG TPA: YciI family protein [Gaiellaceae bacterium]
MAKFVYIYTGGGVPASEEEGQKLMKAWMDWLGGMGDHVTDTGNPFGASKSVNGNGATNATGYSIVEAGSLDEAAEHAKGCPVFAGGGNVEVYEALSM